MYVLLRGNTGKLLENNKKLYENNEEKGTEVIVEI
jgi:hypothetical protein